MRWRDFHKRFRFGQIWGLPWKTLYSPHAFDYSRYRNTMENACHRNKVKLIKVNPYRTSQIGKQKYCNKKKLNVHQAASYVIARKGQGFMDTYNKKVG